MCRGTDWQLRVGTLMRYLQLPMPWIPSQLFDPPQKQKRNRNGRMEHNHVNNTRWKPAAQQNSPLRVIQSVGYSTSHCGAVAQRLPCALYKDVSSAKYTTTVCRVQRRQQHTVTTGWDERQQQRTEGQTSETSRRSPRYQTRPCPWKRRRPAPPCRAQSAASPLAGSGEGQ